MSDYSRWSFQRKIDWFRRQFVQHAGLPFSDVLPALVIVQVTTELCKHCYYGAIYNPVTVVWLFLSQVIHANPSMAAAVEGFAAWRVGQGLPPCSSV